MLSVSLILVLLIPWKTIRANETTEQDMCEFFNFTLFVSKTTEQDKITDAIKKYTHNCKKHPARYYRDRYANWIVAGAQAEMIEPKILFAVLVKEGSLRDPEGPVGEVGPGQLHGTAYNIAKKHLGATKNQMKILGSVSIRASAHWLSRCKKTCPDWYISMYHTGRCKSSAYERRVYNIIKKYYEGDEDVE